MPNEDEVINDDGAIPQDDEMRQNQDTADESESGTADTTEDDQAI